MPSYHDTRELPYSAEQMFLLVADIERYPEFLPWCKAAKIRERESEEVLFADLVIHYKIFSERYTSKVYLMRPIEEGDPFIINASLVQGPFTHLENHWEFHALSEHRCRVVFSVEFAFRSSLLEHTIGMVFDRAARKMATAFEDRARALWA